jgi:4-alpha-glucanotransferase
MNRPGQTYGNWEWRLGRGQLTRALARRLVGVAQQSGRFSASALG